VSAEDRAISDALRVLKERRNWLTARIQAKMSVGWETAYDERERDALTTVLQSQGKE
jgi:hypothetical protein